MHSIWSFRDARLVIPARAIAAGGMSMGMIALVLRVHDSGQGPLAMTALMICMALPAIAFMGLAGRVADSVDSRRVLVIGGLAQAVATVALAVSSGLVANLVFVLVFSTAGTFTAPVWSALVPRIVGDALIGKAVAWQQGLSSTIAPMGGALGGVLVGRAGVAVALWVASGLLLALVVAALAVRTRRGGPADEHLSHEASGGGALAGLRIIRKDSVLFPLFAGLIVLILVAEGVNVVEVFMARDELGASPEAYGFSELFFGGGAVLGAVVAGRLTTTRTRAMVGALGFAATGLVFALVGVATAFWMYLVLAVFIGLTNAAANASAGALLMSRVPDAHRGKVSSALNGVARTASVCALVLGGVVGAWLGPRLTFLTGGALTVAVGLATFVLVRAGLRRDAAAPSVPVAPQQVA